MLQPPQLVLHPMPTVRPMPTLRPTATFHHTLSKLLTHNNHPMPLQATTVRPSSIRINMRINRFPINSVTFHLRPIPIQFTLGDPPVQAEHLLQHHYNLWRRPQMGRV